MNKSILTNPAACVARGIENIIIKKKNSHSLPVKIGLLILSPVLSVTIFPLALTIELIFKRIPKAIASIPFSNDRKKIIKFKNNIDKVGKFALGILFSPFGIRCSDVVSGLFLKTFPSKPAVRPFGVEKEYGKAVHQIEYPHSIQELKTLVKKAKKEKSQISVIGAGMCQGQQTVPSQRNGMVIHTKNLNKIEINPDGNSVKVQAGAIWEDVQMAANRMGKSVIVKQASDIFTIGGSIGINGHGWAHEYGSIASTVESLEIIDAKGRLRTLTPKDEMFGCFFGTLGYFGVVVSATLKLVNNEHLIEKTEEVELDNFIQNYEEKIKGHNIPLFGGRLDLDVLHGNPLKKVYMVRYEKDVEANRVQGKAPLQTANFKKEPPFGTRIERIVLQVISRFTFFSVKSLISRFWKKERKVMLQGKKITRNEALHPPIKAFNMLHHSNLHAQWLQEYFIKKENLPDFLRYLGAQLKANKVRLINATIRPTPKDSISVLPYAEQDRYAVVICFDQLKTDKGIQKTKQWMDDINRYLLSHGDVYYQAYMPFATKAQFEQCYGLDRVNRLRELKEKYDPEHLFGNAHTAKYFDT